MTVSTYGEHAESAAQALNSLIRDAVIPADEIAVDQLLHCREAVLDALRQRLYDVGQDSWYPPPDHMPARTPKPTLAGLDEKLATLVDNIAFALPTIPLDERRSPADYLARASTDTIVDRINPHSLRHTFVTAALDAGVALRDVQDGAGHSDPRTTRKYDVSSRHNLDRHPSYAVSTFYAAGQSTETTGRGGT